MRRLLLFMLLTLSISTLWAQLPVVSGTVTDAVTGKPVAGASVTAAGLTVVTNDDGYFTLKTDSAVSDVTVSHIGYRQQRTSGDHGQPLIVSLQPTAIQLREVLVMADDPRQLLLTAIARIAHNYSQRAEMYHCFYRETAMKRQHYISVAEGVVDMYKTGYRGPSQLDNAWSTASATWRDRVAIRKGRRLLSAKRSDTLTVKVMGGPLAPVQLDIVKDLGMLLNADELDHYRLTMEAPTTIGPRPQFVVSIAPRHVMPYALYIGRLYIDQETLAFTRAELQLDMSDRRKATDQMLVRKPFGVRFRPRELALLIDFRQGGDHLTRLTYIRTTFRFSCDWRRRLFATQFTAQCELAVTSTTTGNSVKPIRGRESFDQRDAFFDKVDYFRDRQFWANYNIIEPTESLDRAINRLLKKY